MNLQKFVFKSHKWLAVGTGILSFLWFFSGIFMTIPERLLRVAADGGTPAEEQKSPFREMRLSPAEAIVKAEQAAGQPVVVSSVSFRQIEGRMHYLISARQGNFLVSSLDGSLLTITEALARRIVAAQGARPEDLGSATLLQSFYAEYTWGPLPVWRIAAHDPKKMIYYVEMDGGEVRSSSRLGRLRGFLTGLHSLEFLNPYLSRGRIRFIMWVFSIAGTTMTLFGFWILWIQFQNWRQRKPA